MSLKIAISGSRGFLGKFLKKIAQKAEKNKLFKKLGISLLVVIKKKGSARANP